MQVCIGGGGQEPAYDVTHQAPPPPAPALRMRTESRNDPREPGTSSSLTLVLRVVLLEAVSVEKDAAVTVQLLTFRGGCMLSCPSFSQLLLLLACAPATAKSKWKICSLEGSED